MTTVSKAQKTTTTKSTANTSAPEWQPIERFDCEIKVGQNYVVGEAFESNGKMYGVEYERGTELLTTRMPIKSVERIEIAKPTVLTEWTRQFIAPVYLKGNDESNTQIAHRYSNETEREYTYQMLMGRWEWSRPGSEPRIFLSEDVQYFTGDGHHTIQALQIALDWLEDAKEDDAEGEPEELVARLKAGLIELPLVVPCLVISGTEADAKAYSLREANRFNGMRLTNIQKRSAVMQLLTDAEQLGKVTAWIGEKVGKVFTGAIPADRAIAAYLGNVSSPLIAEIWESLSPIEYPWIAAEKRLGMDGKQQKVKAKVGALPNVAPTAAAQIEPVTPELEEVAQEQEDRSEKTDSTPAPTESAPVTPGQTYTGKARYERIGQLASEAAAKLVRTITMEMTVKGDAKELLAQLTDGIVAELTYYADGED